MANMTAQCKALEKSRYSPKSSIEAYACDLHDSALQLRAFGHLQDPKKLRAAAVPHLQMMRQKINLLINEIEANV